jgi:hypothetical protein
LLHETLQGKTGQGIVVGVNRLISTTVEDLDCLVFQSNPLYIKADSGEILLKCRTHPSEGQLSKLQISW